MILTIIRRNDVKKETSLISNLHDIIRFSRSTPPRPLIPYMFSIRLVRVDICCLSEHTLHLYYNQNTMAKRKRTNNDLQNITYKTKDRVTRTPLNTGVPSAGFQIAISQKQQQSDTLFWFWGNNVFDLPSSYCEPIGKTTEHNSHWENHPPSSQCCCTD